MKKKHPYHAHLEFLEKTLAEVQKTEDKMQSYNKYIINIEKGKSKYSTSNKDEKEYYKRLFVYLGSRVQTVLHVDKEYKIASIDLINNTIITKNGKIIRTGDMGTGQSQSAFLTGLLNTDNDKKVIALFDEVAMMDEHSLAPVYNKLRSLSKSGKLLIGIIVQKANKTKVNPI
jgi:exonuclease SbcC